LLKLAVRGAAQIEHDFLRALRDQITQRGLNLCGFAIRERRNLDVSNSGFFDTRLDRRLNDLRARQSHLTRLTLMQYSNVHRGAGLTAKKLIDVIQTQIPRRNLAEILNEVPARIPACSAGEPLSTATVYA